MARKCSTALVEPPVAMITATGVLDRLFVTMSRGLQVDLHRLDQHLGGRSTMATISPRVGHGRRVRQAHAERLEGRAHGVGGVHAAARAAAGDRVALDLAEVLLAHLAGRELADRLEHADDVQVRPFQRPGRMVPP